MYNIKPSKHLGQNFLIDKGVVKKIIKAANLKPLDIVLEIGPGLGVLTKELVKKVKQVIAVEKDPRMCEILKEELKDFKNIEIIHADILCYPERSEGSRRSCNNHGIPRFARNDNLIPKIYKIVANLPFYITAPTIRKFLGASNPPKEMVLMVQKEVAQRICASPAKVFAKQKFRRARPPRMNLLAISVQFYAKPKIISYVSKESFWPQPKVDSAILKITPRINTDRKLINTDMFFKIIRAGFSQPRKQLANNLSKMLKLDKQKIISLLLKTNIQPSQRAETLFIKDWLNLTKVL